jgi:hypothetical protein
MLPNHLAGPVLLTSWKEIAHYMGKGVRTVQRWEQEFGLPVRRARSESKKAVLARTQDLDAWVALRCDTRRCSDGGEGRVSLAPRTELAAHIATSRDLRESNRILCAQLRLTLSNLTEMLDAMSHRVA